MKKSVEVVIRNALAFSPDAVMLIKSTIPLGYTRDLFGED